jgi:hypothetical protein
MLRRGGMIERHPAESPRHPAGDAHSPLTMLGIFTPRLSGSPGPVVIVRICLFSATNTWSSAYFRASGV